MKLSKTRNLKIAPTALPYSSKVQLVHVPHASLPHRLQWHMFSLGGSTQRMQPTRQSDGNMETQTPQSCTCMHVARALPRCDCDCEP